MEKVQHLFVYGTLAPGRPNEHILADVQGSWREATVKGELIEQGWGAQMGYPAIRLDDRGGEVQGLVFTSASLQEHWQTLDAFEGSEYRRRETQANLPDGQSLPVYIYTLNESGEG